MVALGSHTSKRKLVRRFLRRLFHKITEAFVPFAGKFPAVRLENRIGAHGKIQIFGIGAHATVNHRSYNSNQISVLIVDRPATIARTNGSGDLDRILIAAGNDSSAQGKTQTLRMADNENVFTFVDGGLP